MYYFVLRIEQEKLQILKKVYFCYQNIEYVCSKQSKCTFKKKKKVFLEYIQFLQNLFSEFFFLSFFEKTYILTPQSLFIVLTFDNLIIQQLTTDHTAYLSKQKYSKFGTSAKREQKIVAGLEIRDRAWASPSALIRKNPCYGVSLVQRSISKYPKYLKIS